MYRCSWAVGRKRDCTAPAVISADPLETHVRDALAHAYDAPSFRVGSDLAEELAAAEVRLEEAAAEVRLEEAAAELEAFALDTTRRKALGAEVWDRALDARVQARDDAR